MKPTNIYDHQQIESKWSTKWEEEKTDNVKLLSAPKPFYNLMMYPYPSAEGLHVGNVYAFTGSDIHGRFQRMKGFDVFEPIGFDSGGIHSENFAIKMGVHPRVMTAKNIVNFTKQLKRAGNMYDWNHTVDVMQPEYYKWTQWVFTQLFKAGLAYKKQAPVTWCPSCKTSVSDEQTEKRVNSEGVEVTVCERCKTPVEKRNLNQWFFKITDYADRLLQNTYKLNWPEKILTTQRNWIGKSEGVTLKFPMSSWQAQCVQDLSVNEVNQQKDSGQAGMTTVDIEVFTTRPDTLYGATFLTVAPEYPNLLEMVPEDYKDTVSKYIKKTLAKTEQERKAETKTKTGEFTGLYVINPVSNEPIPLWVADYVLMEYGSGAVMGVPAHDQRDFEFAKKFNLPVKEVVTPQEPLNNSTAYAGSGTLINSGPWTGWKYPEDLDKVITWLEEHKIGKKTVTFKLRDWNISRQRYWGPPIPMIFCPKCAAEGKSWFTNSQDDKGREDMVGWYPVPDKDLPVVLPDIDDYLPDGSGKAPLARHPEFVNTACPYCGGPAQRETDVSDTFMDSSWYFLRYPSTPGGDIDIQRSKEHAFDSDVTKKWLPVNQYCGGAEHSVLHLMYSRFITMVLHDLDYLNFEEPFPNFYAHGLIIKDGNKMSKSRGNIVNPDEYMNKYGADVLRLYLSFMGPYADGGDFRDSGIAGMQRFLGRVWRVITELSINNVQLSDKERIKELEIKLNQTIKKVTEGIERFKYNTSIAALMELMNTLEAIPLSPNQKPSEVDARTALWDESNPMDKALKTLVLLLAPFAPYVTEELWQRYSPSEKEFVSVHHQPWPIWDEANIKGQVSIVAIQVNGKVRTTINVLAEAAQDQTSVRELALKNEAVNKYLDGKKVVKEFFVPGRLINLIVS